MHICGYMRSIFIINCIFTIYNVSRAAFDRISGDLSQKVDALASGPRNLPDTAVASCYVRIRPDPDVPRRGEKASPADSY